MQIFNLFSLFPDLGKPKRDPLNGEASSKAGSSSASSLTGTSLRLSIKGSGSGLEGLFRPGAKVEGMVVEQWSGGAVIEVAGQRVSARLSSPLEVGTRVVFEVLKGGRPAEGKLISAVPPQEVLTEAASREIVRLRSNATWLIPRLKGGGGEAVAHLVREVAQTVPDKAQLLGLLEGISLAPRPEGAAVESLFNLFSPALLPLVENDFIPALQAIAAVFEGGVLTGDDLDSVLPQQAEGPNQATYQGPGPSKSGAAHAEQSIIRPAVSGGAVADSPELSPSPSGNGAILSRPVSPTQPHNGASHGQATAVETPSEGPGPNMVPPSAQNSHTVDASSGLGGGGRSSEAEPPFKQEMAEMVRQPEVGSDRGMKQPLQGGGVALQAADERNVRPKSTVYFEEMGAVPAGEAPDEGQPQGREGSLLVARDGVQGGAAEGPSHEPFPAALAPEGKSSPFNDASLHLHTFHGIVRHIGSTVALQHALNLLGEIPFLIIPLWFRDGAALGYLAVWQDEGGEEGGAKGEGDYHLLFDLEMDRLGHLTMDVIRRGRGVGITAYVGEEVLSHVKEAMPRLEEEIASAGFSVLWLRAVPHRSEIGSNDSPLHDLADIDSHFIDIKT